MLPVAVARSASYSNANKLYTSGFVDYVMFSHNRSNEIIEIEETFCGRTDGRTHGRTDILSKSRPKHHTSKFQQIFCTCYLWPWLGPPLTAMQYAMYL